jgi:hypothetical protein
MDGFRPCLILTSKIFLRLIQYDLQGNSIDPAVWPSQRGGGVMLGDLDPVGGAILGKMGGGGARRSSGCK